MKNKQPLALTGLHHITLRVPDMDKSLAFYRDVLGFSPKTSFLLDGLRFAMLETGNGCARMISRNRSMPFARPAARSPCPFGHCP